MTTTPTAAARVSGTIKALARSFHDGPLGASEHAFDETSEQGKWCIEVATFFLAAIQPDPEPQPVAWRYRPVDKKSPWSNVTEHRRTAYGRIGMEEQPLYATPSSAGTVSVEAAAGVLMVAQEAYFDGEGGSDSLGSLDTEALSALAGEGGR